MTFRITAPLIGIVAATLATPALAANINITSNGPVIELTVNEVVQSAPDVATVGAGVTTRSTSAQEAMRMNAVKMDSVIDRLRKLGIKREDIQTATFSLSPQYNYRNDGQQPTFLGYDVSNTVNVTLRDLDKVGPTLDALVQAGATNFYGPNFMLEKDGAARTEARKAAFAHGNAQALDYARMAGFTGIRLLEVSETFNQVGPVPVSAQAINVSSRGGESATKIEPGRVGTAVTVTVKYEMTR